MKITLILSSLLFSSLLFSVTISAQKQRPLAVENGKIFTEDGKKYLWGGEREEQHFDISNCELKDDQFHYGIGRERFPALIKPEFTDVQDAKSYFENTDRFLLLEMDGTVKAYSVKDLTRHEVVNDEVNGQPIMAAYCILADLGAIYERTIGGREYTFALSGYTYFDPEVWDGMDGFVFWDRETESLWWPLIGRSVSGKMKGTPLTVLDEQYWKQTTWKDVVNNYSEAQVLIPGQDFERPKKWKTYKDVQPVKKQKGKAVAPRWGENGN